LLAHHLVTGTKERTGNSIGRLIKYGVKGTGGPHPVLYNLQGVRVRAQRVLFIVRRVGKNRDETSPYAKKILKVAKGKELLLY